MKSWATACGSGRPLTRTWPDQRGTFGRPASRRSRAASRRAGGAGELRNAARFRRSSGRGEQVGPVGRVNESLANSFQSVLVINGRKIGFDRRVRRTEPLFADQPYQAARAAGSTLGDDRLI